jgi:hypothetical protein
MEKAGCLAIQQVFGRLSYIGLEQVAPGSENF